MQRAVPLEVTGSYRGDGFPAAVAIRGNWRIETMENHGIYKDLKELYSDSMRYYWNIPSGLQVYKKTMEKSTVFP